MNARLSRHAVVASAMLLASLCNPASCLAAAPPQNEQEFRKQMALEDYKDITYRDAKGTTIDFTEFQKIVAVSKGYSTTKDPEKSLAIVSIVDQVRPSTEKLKVKRGELLPEPSLRDLDGRIVDLHARKGRPLLLNFFFAACAPCIAETPALNAFAKQHPEVDVLAVTFDERAEARKFVAKHGLEWAIAADAKGFIDSIGVKSYPKLAYLGKDGKLLGIGVPKIAGDGDLTTSDIDAWMRKLDTR